MRAAHAGVHVLCEKPLAVTDAESERIINACREASVKLMTAYRLHFEPLSLEMVDLVRRGRIGEPRVLQLVVLDARDARRHPDADGNRRRDAL